MILDSGEICEGKRISIIDSVSSMEYCFNKIKNRLELIENNWGIFIWIMRDS